MHPSFVCRTRRPTLNLRPNILIPNKTPKALSKCPCKMHLQKTRFDRSLQLCSRWVVEYLGQYLQQVGGGIFVAIFVAGGWMNIGDNICNRWVMEYLGQYLQQVGRGIFWTIFTAGEWSNIWRNFCRLVGEYFGEYFQQVGGGPVAGGGLSTTGSNPATAHPPTIHLSALCAHLKIRLYIHICKTEPIFMSSQSGNLHPCKCLSRQFIFCAHTSKYFQKSDHT